MGSITTKWVELTNVPLYRNIFGERTIDSLPVFSIQATREPFAKSHSVAARLAFAVAVSAAAISGPVELDVEVLVTVIVVVLALCKTVVVEVKEVVTVEVVVDPEPR